MPSPALWTLPTLAYTAGMAAVAAWTRRHARPVTRRLPPEQLPRAAVLVAARNEEHTLPACLAALLAQDYPPDRLEVLVANDHSTDGTADVVARFARQAPGCVRLVPVPPPRGTLRGKALALHAAIEATDADLLLVTDADCTPPPTWAATMASYFADPRVGVVCGQTLVEARPDRPVEAIQALDWTYFLALCAAVTEAGLPATAMGNNMAFRRAAYEAVGGYPALPFSVTEDFLLFQAIAERTAWKARFPADPRLHVRTRPLACWRDVYAQRRRWARGGLRARPAVLAGLGLVFAAHAGPALVLHRSPGGGLAALLAKLAADATLLLAALSGQGRTSLLRAFLPWQASLHATLLTLPFSLALQPRITWKGRRH